MEWRVNGHADMESAARGARDGDELESVVVPLADIGPDEIGRLAHPHHGESGPETTAAGAAGREPVWRWTVTVDGTCRRTTTSLVDRRRDAILSATRFIEAAKRIVRFERTRLDAVIAHAPADRAASEHPQGRFVLVLELRRTDPATAGRVYERLAAEAWTIGRLGATTFTFVPHEHNPSVVYDDQAHDGLDFPSMSYDRAVAPATSAPAERAPQRSSRAG